MKISVIIITYLTMSNSIRKGDASVSQKNNNDDDDNLVSGKQIGGAAVVGWVAGLVLAGVSFCSFSLLLYP